MTILFSDPLFLRHDTGRGHLERPDRLRAVAANFDESLIDDWDPSRDYLMLTIEATAHLVEESRVRLARVFGVRTGSIQKSSWED